MSIQKEPPWLGREIPCKNYMNVNDRQDHDSLSDLAGPLFFELAMDAERPSSSGGR